MGVLIEPEFWLRWLGIVVLDLTLAGDNALVIALAVWTLPPRQQFWGRVWGTVGAVVLRLAFIAIISYLLGIPLLRFAGGALLLWIGARLVMQEGGGDGEQVRHGTTLLQAIWVIIVADVVMSLDNVLAVAAAAHGDMVLVVLGIALSLPLVVWGSGVVSRLMGRYPWIVWLGGGVLGWVAGEMMLKDDLVRRWIGATIVEALHYPLPFLLALALTGIGWRVATRQRLGRDRMESA